MKKSILVAGCILAGAIVSYGQGQVAFSNYFSSSSPAVGLNGGVADVGGGNPGSTGSNLGLGPGYSAQLAYFIGATTDMSALTPLNYTSGGNMSPVAFGLGAATSNGGLGSGWFDGGLVTIPGVDSANAGDITYQVLVLKGSSVVMYSPLFQGTAQATSTSPVPNLPQGNWQTSFVPVPEPTTFALAGLGAVAMLVMRRRKQ